MEGKSFKNFGELVGISVSGAPTAQAAPGFTCATPGGTYDAAALAGFDHGLGGNLTLTTASDVDKEAQFEREYTAACRMPQLSYVMGNDHTEGTSSGKLIPQAHVATNDLAIGNLVAFLSHSFDWASTAVFVVEDDSQNGLDHRDDHRNIALVASPYAKQGALSSVHISQVSIVRTIELILGLDPISSYTQYAPVPYDLFTAKPDLTPYTAVTPAYDMTTKNSAAATGSAASVPLDLREADLAGPVLEAQLWQATAPREPAAHHAAPRTSNPHTRKQSGPQRRCCRTFLRLLATQCQTIVTTGAVDHTNDKPTPVDGCPKGLSAAAWILQACWSPSNPARDTRLPLPRLYPARRTALPDRTLSRNSSVGRLPGKCRKTAWPSVSYADRAVLGPWIHPRPRPRSEDE